MEVLERRLNTSAITNETWRVEAEMVSSAGESVVVEVRLSSPLTGALSPFAIKLERDDDMTKADYEAQALIVLAESSGDLESACIRESIRKGV